MVLAALILAAIVVMRIAPEQRRIEPEPTYMPDKSLPRLALVLDDLGYTLKNLEGIKDLGVPLTLAVLPGLKYSEAVCAFAEKNGIEVIVHLPMEPGRKGISLEKDTIMTDMKDSTIRQIVNDSFRTVPGARGVSNHMGSGATKDPRVLSVIFGEIRKRNMFFLDSFTTSGSVCGKVGVQAGITCLKRDVFIDNDPKVDAVIRQMETAGEKARLNGRAIAIGHDKDVTVTALKEVIPRMKKEGIRFVVLSDMIEEAR